MPDLLTCAFCGKEYPPGTPTSQHTLLEEHIKKCPKHPVREDVRRLVELIAQADKADTGGEVVKLGLYGEALVEVAREMTERYDFFDYWK